MVRKRDILLRLKLVVVVVDCALDCALDRCGLCMVGMVCDDDSGLKVLLILFILEMLDSRAYHGGPRENQP